MEKFGENGSIGGWQRWFWLVAVSLHFSVLFSPHPVTGKVLEEEAPVSLCGNTAMGEWLFGGDCGAIPSSMLGLEAMTGCLEDFGFEDYLNDPRESETFRPADMHHGMEVNLGISKGPICPSFIASMLDFSGILGCSTLNVAHSDKLKQLSMALFVRCDSVCSLVGQDCTATRRDTKEPPALRIVM
ncbi:unnamed protein product [Ilex paraguariensis]|uniref:Uncharacterized protein n=1 Tax=Ilex paraguariensis TaxID=185542 RepID=A0ABC8R487_9AQUA